MAQLDLFPKTEPVISTVPTEDEVRARLTTILDLLRAASEMPWSAREAARWKLIVPQMADWLPPEEREAICSEFAALVGTLEARAA